MAGTDLDPSVQFGRFVVTDRPQATPGCCVVCGYAGADRRFLDFRLDFEFYGSLYLCHDCMVDAGNCLGFATPEVHQAALDRILAQSEAIAELTESLRLSEQTVDVLSQRRLSDRALDAARDISPDASGEGETEQPADYRHTKRPAARPKEFDSGPSEQISEPGPDDSGTIVGDLLDL